MLVAFLCEEVNVFGSGMNLSQGAKRIAMATGLGLSAPFVVMGILGRRSLSRQLGVVLRRLGASRVVTGAVDERDRWRHEISWGEVVGWFIESRG